MRLFLKILVIMAIISAQAFIFSNKASAKLTIAELDPGEGNFAADGEIAARYAYWNWFKPSGSTADDSLATVCEMMAMYKFLSGTLYWGHAFGEDVIENIYEGDENGDYF